MKMLIIIVAFYACLVSSTAGQSPSENFTHTAVLDNNNNVYLYWKYNSTYITFEIVGKTNGWVGMGISPNGGMANADIYVGWVKNGTANITDRHGDTKNGFPPIDPNQDVILLSGNETNGWTKIKFQRQFAACESTFDTPITGDTLKIIWALGINDPLGDDISSSDYHGFEFRGAKSLMILDGPIMTDPPSNQTTQSFEVLNHAFTIPTTETYYNCKMIEFPKFSSKQHIVEVSPIIQPGHETYVHHILLYQCDYQIIQNASLINTTQECYSTMPLDFLSCTSVFFSWAVGGGTFYYPNHVGLPLGTSDSPKYVIMETHYDNPELRSGIVDNSGLKIVYTSQLREYDAGIIQVGHYTLSVAQLIPPNADSYLQYGSCYPDCLTTGMNSINRTDIKIFANLLHSHLLGRKLTLKHITSNGTELKYISQDNSYDFNYQETKSFKDEIVVQSGDALQMVCDYNSNSRKTFTLGGLGTQEEMCMSFVFYYPKIPLTRCESFPLNPYSYFGIDTAEPDQPFSLSLTLNNMIVTSPVEFANRTVASIANSINWNQTLAAEMSTQTKNLNVIRTCDLNTDLNFQSFLFQSPIEIIHPYVPPQLVCKKTSDNSPSSSSHIKPYFCSFLMLLVVYLY